MVATDFYSYAIVDLEFDIQPILANLQVPQTGLPVDLPPGSAGSALQALWFRGILLADEQHRLRPADAITRGELAGAIAQTIHLPLPREASIKLPADAGSAADSDDVVLVVSAGLMKLDKAGHFRPQEAVTREEAAMSLVSLARLFGTELPKAQPIELKDKADITAASRESVQAAIRAGLILPDDDRFRPAKALTRQEAAVAICRVIDFDWVDCPADANRYATEPLVQRTTQSADPAHHAQTPPVDYSSTSTCKCAVAGRPAVSLCETLTT